MDTPSRTIVPTMPGAPDGKKRKLHLDNIKRCNLDDEYFINSYNPSNMDAPKKKRPRPNDEQVLLPHPVSLSGKFDSVQGHNENHLDPFQGFVWDISHEGILNDKQFDPENF